MWGSVLGYLEINSEGQEGLIMKIYNKRLFFNEKVEMPENLLEAVDNYLETFGIIAVIKAGSLRFGKAPYFQSKRNNSWWEMR